MKSEILSSIIDDKNNDVLEEIRSSDLYKISHLGSYEEVVKELNNKKNKESKNE